MEDETDYDSLWQWQKVHVLALREYQPQCHLEKFRKDLLLKFPGSWDIYKPCGHVEDYTRNPIYAFTCHLDLWMLHPMLDFTLEQDPRDYNPVNYPKLVEEAHVSKKKKKREKRETTSEYESTNLYQYKNKERVIRSIIFLRNIYIYFLSKYMAHVVV